MEANDLLMIIVVCGVALTCCYIVAEWRSWKTAKASDYRAGLALREMYKRIHSKTKPYLVRAIRRNLKHR
jgi:hypothetical protein